MVKFSREFERIVVSYFSIVGDYKNNAGRYAQIS